MIRYITKDVVDSYIATETDSFALEAYRYNCEINNWENPVIAYYDDNNIVGLLYYRYRYSNLIQLINIYSMKPGVGTKLFNELLTKDYKYMYFYMGKNAIKFYSKYDIVPLQKTDDFMLTFIDKSCKSVIPDEYRDFILSRLKK